MDILYYRGGEIPEGTTTLYCDYAYLKEIPAFPEGLVEISITGCQVTKIPPLPKSLRQLNLADNCLIELPELHEGLEFLSVNNNDLNRLPKLPSTLKILRCNDTPHLERLPELPEGLQELQWLNRTRHILPLLPTSLNLLKSQYNKKTGQPEVFRRKEIEQLRRWQDESIERKILSYQHNKAARRIQRAWDNYWYRPNEEGESRAAKHGYAQLPSV